MARNILFDFLFISLFLFLIIIVRQIMRGIIKYFALHFICFLLGVFRFDEPCTILRSVARSFRLHVLLQHI